VRFSAPPLLFGLLLSACQGAEGSSEPTPTAIHALLRIERSARVGADQTASGLAFVGVVRLPEVEDPGPLLRLSGKSLALPPLGQCQAPSRERDAVLPSDLARAEFLNAGDVSLGTADTHTLLAPRNFPLDVAGVVYTSRDRASEPLPSAVPYLLKATGSDQLPPLELRVQAPDELREVTVGGAVFEALSSVDTQAPLLVTWRPGDARDTVYLEVSGAEAGTLGVCAFRDAEGGGALPSGLFGASGAGSLSLHRLRNVAADVPTLDGAEVRFDFALGTDVSFH
jgi:hypothetical protein